MKNLSFIQDKKLWTKLWHNKLLYLMLIPVIANFIIFHYMPMYGLQIAFKRYNLVRGLGGSPWAGIENFNKFFSSVYFVQLFRNTLVISFYSRFILNSSNYHIASELFKIKIL